MIIRLANYFSASYQCHLLPALNPEEINYDVSQLSLHNFHSINEHSKIRKLYNFVLWLFFLFFRLRKLKPNVSISFLERSNVANVIICKLLNIKSTISVRNNLEAQYSDKSPFAKRVIYKILGFFYRRADCIVVVAEQLEMQLINNLNLAGCNLITIYNPQPMHQFRESASQPIKNKTISMFIEGKKSAIAIGRLTHQKGFIHLIRAFKQVHDQINDSALIILGEGTLKSKLDGTIDELGLQDSVKIFDYENNPFSVIDKCDVFAFPSLYEGIANALLEALSIGKRIVTTDCLSGPREILGFDLGQPPLIEPVRLTHGSIVPRLDTSTIAHSSDLTKEETFLATELIYQLNVAQNLNKLHPPKTLEKFDEAVVMSKWNQTVENLINLR